MTVAVDSSKQQTCTIGIDVGGTKCAGGLVSLPSGAVLARHLQPTRPERGGAAVLDDVIAVARSLKKQAVDLGVEPAALGIGLAELIGVNGRPLSGATIDWRNLAAADALRQATALPVRMEADVRAAARAEARLGAGRSHRSFLFVTVGTGISASHVVAGVPYVGARGLTGTFASAPGLIPSDGRLATGPPLEQFAAGPALAARLAAARPGFTGAGPDVLALASDGDRDALAIVTSAGEAVGAAIGQLVNMLDPDAVVLGGGLGLAGGIYRQSLETAMRTHIWSELHRELPLVSAELGNDAGFIGAALAAAPM